MDDYRDGDVYYALAQLCGLTDDPDREALEESTTRTCGSA